MVASRLIILKLLAIFSMNKQCLGYEFVTIMLGECVDFVELGLYDSAQHFMVVATRAMYQSSSILK